MHISAETLLTDHLNDRLAWGVVNQSLALESFSHNWGHVLADATINPAVGQPLTDFFDEFVGLDGYIQTIMRSRLPEFRLERINRPISEAQTGYFDFSLKPISNSRFLLFTIENKSDFGQLEQLIVQERNELRLTRSQLAVANEELKRLDHFKSLFFSMAAHDLRSPLMTIKGYADLLDMLIRQEMPPERVPEAQEFLSTITIQGDWLDQLIHNILDLNQIESSRFELELELCNLNDVVRNSADALRPMAALSDLELTVGYVQDGALICVDAKRIEQCIHNLVTNAIKYSPMGGKVSIDLSTTEEQAVIVVSDTGHGISEQQLPHVFDLYYRTSDAVASTVSGTGLGLFVVRSIVELHGGTIVVQSEAGKGTSFEIRLPNSTNPTGLANS